MIFPGISAIRRTNDRNPNLGVTTAGIATLLLVIGLGSRQATGFVIGTNDVNHGGRHGKFVDIDKLKPLKGEHTRRAMPVDDVNVKLILKRGAYYNKENQLCMCDQLRSYPVIPSMPDDQRAGYCVQICGAPLEGVQSNAATTTIDSSLVVITSLPPQTSSSISSKSTENPQTPVAPIAPVAPTAPTAPIPPAAPTAPTAPAPPSAPTGPSSGNAASSSTDDVNRNIANGNGNGNGNGDGNANSGGDHNTALKIGVGAAVGVIMSAVAGFCFWFFLCKRNKRRLEEDGIAFGCVGDQADVHPALRSEKYIYSAPHHGSKHSIGSKHSHMHNRTTPPSPHSIPPAYSAPAGGVIPSSTNTSSTSLDTTPPILPLGAPSRVLDLNGGTRPFVPLTNRIVSPPPEAAGPSSAVVPPSITFFLHPLKNDTELEEEEKRWLDVEQKRIREKKEAVEELSKLRAEEDRIREKIRERMRNGH
ncbi:hypothetical protein BGX38DRAFT_1166547 [Terfezia claveryi]|nr:hypothetical protein BGX38DRAFT_1245322 [Terfezia claveryi]KAF8455732.1 hypothetical protein BGX38DRAFT_1166547 [Terfezia claveryi]